MDFRDLKTDVAAVVSRERDGCKEASTSEGAPVSSADPSNFVHSVSQFHSDALSSALSFTPTMAERGVLPPPDDTEPSPSIDEALAAGGLSDRGDDAADHKPPVSKKKFEHLSGFARDLMPDTVICPLCENEKTLSWNRVSRKEEGMALGTTRTGSRVISRTRMYRAAVLIAFCALSFRIGASWGEERLNAWSVDREEGYQREIREAEAKFAEREKDLLARLRDAELLRDRGLREAKARLEQRESDLLQELQRAKMSGDVDLRDAEVQCVQKEKILVLKLHETKLLQEENKGLTNVLQAAAGAVGSFVTAYVLGTFGVCGLS